MKQTQQGFTLIELAIASLVLVVLLGAAIVPLRMEVDLRKTVETRELLAKARESLLAYAVTHGHFPCPADATSAGREPAGSDHTVGTCPTYQGFLPAATLGFSRTDAQGFAVDAWGGTANRLRYAVASNGIGPSSNTNTLTRTSGLRTASLAALTDEALSLLHVCGDADGVIAGTSCGTAQTLTSAAPVVVWSVGANGAIGGSSAAEAQNPNPNGGSADRIFVSRERSDVAGREFDDLVTWVSMPALLGRVISAGHLP